MYLISVYNVFFRSYHIHFIKISGFTKKCFYIVIMFYFFFIPFALQQYLTPEARLSPSVSLMYEYILDLNPQNSIMVFHRIHLSFYQSLFYFL